MRRPGDYRRPARHAVAAWACGALVGVVASSAGAVARTDCSAPPDSVTAALDGFLTNGPGIYQSHWHFTVNSHGGAGWAHESKDGGGYQGLGAVPASNDQQTFNPSDNDAATTSHSIAVRITTACGSADASFSYVVPADTSAPTCAAPPVISDFHVTGMTPDATHANFLDVGLSATANDFGSPATTNLVRDGGNGGAGGSLPGPRLLRPSTQGDSAKTETGRPIRWH